MGQTGSKSPESFAQVDGYVDDMVLKLKSSINALNKNDIKSLKKTVESMPEGKKLTSNMVKHIVKVINNTEESLDMIDKPARSYQDNELKGYIDSITMRKVSSIREDLRKENIDVANPVLSKQVDELFMPVATMHTKYKFYMYKYVQLNIFLILFANHVQEIMDIQYKSIIEYQKMQASKDDDLIKNLVKMMNKIADMDDAKLESAQREEIEILGKNAIQAAESRINNLETFVSDMKKNSFEDIIKMFVDTQEDIVKEIEKVNKK